MPQPPRLVPWRVAIPLTTAAAVAGAGIGFLVVSLVVNPSRGSAEAAPSGALAAASAPSASDTPVSARSGAADSGAADSSAAVDSGAADAGATAADAAGPVDLSDAGLKPYESYLFVRSTAQADVWVHGIKIGPTNHKLKLACTKGLRFTRLGKDPGPAWISKAVSVKIPCGSVTELELEPESNPKALAAPQNSDNPY
ncbi:MAG: hypothetical protein H6716_06350 [Polyangiaceae bacterium]|nr:hypothetical protein [Polyangiaceae bacterium]